MHFLSMNLEVGLPAAAKDYEDNPGYNISNINSSEELLEIWKKSQRHLEEFWKKNLEKSGKVITY